MRARLSELRVYTRKVKRRNGKQLRLTKIVPFTHSFALAHVRQLEGNEHCVFVIFAAYTYIKRVFGDRRRRIQNEIGK